MAKRSIYYNRTNTCDRCRVEKNIETKLYPGNAFRERNKEGNWTGRWDCRNCWRRYDPNSDNSMIKSLRYHRMGDLDANCSSAKGSKFEELTVMWQGVDNLNIKSNNYNSPIDHSRHSILGVIQTKGSYLRIIGRYIASDGEERYYKGWHASFLREHGKVFDHLIYYCASEDGKKIERIYIFPWKEVTNRTGISIYLNSLQYTWYEKYRLKDEEEVKKVNKIWRLIINDQ